jgi:hypothetical protein
LDGSREPNITLFEYISVGVAIVLSFGVVRILDGAPFALERKKRYWPHFLWLAIKFENHFVFWWLSWGTRDADWQFLNFLAQLGTPVVLYLQASTLVTPTPGAITDWRAHFYATRRRFFGLNVAYLFATILSRSLSFGQIPPVPVFIMIAAGLATSIVGYCSSSHRVQSGVVLFALFLNLVLIATGLVGSAG